MISKKYRYNAHLIVVGYVMLGMCGETWSAGKRSQGDGVQKAIHRSAHYLTASVKKDGMFIYRINMDATRRVKKKYNILRHAGTIYSMSMYYRLNPDADVLSAIKKAGRYLQTDAMRPLPENDAITAIWSDPKVNQSGKALQAKLGGAGIGLVALLSIESIHPGFTPLSDLQALGRFVVFMQKENGDFYSKYIPSTGGRMDNWRSLYYPGEAALGLVMLYELDPKINWLQAAINALAYLARHRESKATVPADHWALLATDKALSITSLGGLSVPRNLLINHAVQISEAILQDQIENHEKPEYNGGFSNDGRTTPTATRLEGLQAALNFLPADHEIRKRIDAAVSRGISFLLRAQVNEGKFIGAFPRATQKLDDSFSGAAKFNRRATEVRIDYVQHALSAMIQYLHLMGGSKKE